MIITKAVKFYYRVSDGLLCAKFPPGEMLRWIPVKLWLSFKGQVNSKSGLIVNVSHIKREVNARLSANDVHCKSVYDIIAWVFRTFDDCFACCRLIKAELELDEHSFSVLAGSNDMLILTRKYELAAAHRLWNDSWDNARNYQEFGKCANPNGHGHNYTLEVSVCCDMSDPDARCVDPSEIDQVVNDTVMEQFDHKNLCLDIPEMQNLVPTVENMSIVIWNILKGKFIQARLHNIRIWETCNTYADYNGELI